VLPSGVLVSTLRLLCILLVYLLNLRSFNDTVFILKLCRVEWNGEMTMNAKKTRIWKTMFSLSENIILTLAGSD
jgi:hypothetical protein